LRVTFLGTGTSQGVPVVACSCEVCQSGDSKDKRLRTSVLIEVDNHHLVIDAGPDFRQQMLRANVMELSAILLTHEHYDHIAGLDDIRAFNWVQKKPIDIYAEHRVHQSVKQIFYYVFASEKYPGIPQMTLHEVDENPFFIVKTEIIPIRGLHLKLPVFGYRIEKFAYLTDMNSLDSEEEKKLSGLEVLVVNALRKESHVSHFTLSQALGLIKRLNPRKAYITHISHQMGKSEEVSLELPENVYLAFDGLVIDFEKYEK
jgi:phosphoribosyl 1,2-cyclic phosphate phosphodiesterase